jgi:hypothetical protein
VANYGEATSDGTGTKAEYIFYTELSASTLGKNSVNGTVIDSSSLIVLSPTKEGFLTYGMYFVLLNTLIPLSLVVSIEFIKLVQTFFIGSDMTMYDESCQK